jgi:hypothetical protein
MSRRLLCGLSTLVLLAFVARAWPDDPNWPAMPYTLHRDFQAVDANGFATFPVFNGEPVKMRGVILNNPSDMLDPTPGADPFMGGLWQIFVQTVDADDFGGTACWMGQNIGNMSGDPNDSYTDAEWLAELDRLNHDPVSGQAFQPGDLVEVRARAPGLPFRGKTNINEQHSGNPEANFDVCLLEADYGLPTPEPISLSDVKSEDDQFIFDQQRLVGAEHYQGTLLRINEVEFQDTTAWGPDGELVIQDGTGRTLAVKLGLGEGFSVYDPPPPPFDIIAIFDQEDYNSDDGLMDGYRLWVMNYDGNGEVINGEACMGDLDGDGRVGLGDLAILLSNYGTGSGAGYVDGDLDRDGDVDLNDLSALLSAYGNVCW